MRLPPLPPEDWPLELDYIRQQLRVPLNIHNVMAHHAALTQAWMPFRYHIVRDSSLLPRQRELLILRTAANTQAHYEWEHHVVRGREAGLSDEEIQRVKEGPAAAGWQAIDVSLLQAADDCYHRSTISDDTYAELQTHFDAPQLLDIIATVGMYMILAVIINTFQVPMEEE